MAQAEKEKVATMKIVVKQVRSVIGRDRRFRSTMSALGLQNIGQEKEILLTPAVAGMLNRVKQIVRVRKA